MTDTTTDKKSKVRTVKICNSCGKPVGRQGVSSLTSWLFQETFCQCQLRESTGNSKTDPTPTGALFEPGLGAGDRFDLPDLGAEYEVLERIGKGGMGSVYKVKDLQQDRFLAVKVLHDELKTDQQSVIRFEREAKAALKLMHANLVPVFSYGTSSVGSPYLVMDFVDGVSLETKLKNESYLEVSTAINIFIQICDALTHAHQHGIIHRDLKPGNIIITVSDDGQEIAKLVDFGIAKVRSATGRETQNLTQTGEVFGSPHYMSPEQCLGFDLDSRSDIYSLGCVMYECVSGKSPFDGHNAVQLIAKHLSAEAPPLRICDVSQGSKVNERLAAIIYKCLEKDPQNRYFSAELLSGDLRRLTFDVTEKSGLALPRKLSVMRSLFAFFCLASVCSALLLTVPTQIPFLLALPALAALTGSLSLMVRINDFVSRMQFQAKAIKEAAGHCVMHLVVCQWFLAVCTVLSALTPFLGLAPNSYPLIAASLGLIAMIVVWTGFQLDVESADIQGCLTTARVMNAITAVLILTWVAVMPQFFSAKEPEISKTAGESRFPDPSRMAMSLNNYMYDNSDAEMDDAPSILPSGAERISSIISTNNERTKVFKFPPGLMLGTISFKDRSGEIRSVAAKGMIYLPADASLFLRISQSAASSFAPLLRKFSPDDFEGFSADGKGGSIRFLPNADDVVFYISNWTNLRSIRLADSDLTDEGLKRIGNFKKLVSLSVDRTQVTGAGVAALPQIKQLAELYVAGLQVQPELVLKAIGQSPNLIRLSLGETKLSKADLMQLAHQKNLAYLNLDRCRQVDDDVIRALPRHRLEYLAVAGTKVSPNIIPTLKEFRKLRTLIIEPKNWTAEQRAQLQKALPECLIKENPNLVR